MSGMRICIDVARQELELWQGTELLRRYSISTALRGVGERKGSEQTPRGVHYIRARIGASLPCGAVLRSRRFTGEVWSESLEKASPGRDWILSRILWLCGREPGRNRLGDVDTQQRYIYIHGASEREPMGEPRSHGCIRMRNADVIELFDMVPAGTRVDIIE
jgi:L,D-transpeptidase YbiS